MPPLSQPEKDQLIAQISLELSKTPFACKSLTQLTNGTTNFVFRAVLTHPLPLDALDGGAGNAESTTTAAAATSTKTVIIKHSTAFAALNKDLPIDVSRCVVEESMLNALFTWNSQNTTSTFRIKIPRLHLFIRGTDTNTQVLEDIHGAVDLKALLISPSLTANSNLSHSHAMSIGRALGSWLRDYHAWVSTRSQADLRAEIEANEPMRKLKYCISYNSFIEVIQRFPEISCTEFDKKILKDAKDMAMEEFDRKATAEEGEEWGIIHGDFWTGNVLLVLPERQQAEEETDLFIVDWEFTQFGHRAYDIGQMIGDLLERKHFMQIDAAVWVLEGFIDGYGAVSEDMAFRIAVHTGVQLITWVTRGPPLHMRPAWATRERVVSIVELGITFILKGWNKDMEWLKSSVLAGLLKDEQTVI
ncbi:hypothetical protein LOCC1_G003933 [Lachnellula occidentalis]|uniref:Aminoglycoside phosphotransferase domain-containing protein n=1 Tax=Lachnellula occidentalis TaxID=215460 RepID=A0A8H8RYT6_9HELO|nr:hypothetical protein LOCC1_G003933 [Lachnellula occidentalis]